MNESRRGRSWSLWSLEAARHRGVLDLEEIGTDVAKTRSSRDAIDHPGAVAKLYE